MNENVPLKSIVANNLTELRKEKGLTQIQLAELFVGLVAFFPLFGRVDRDRFEIERRSHAECLAEFFPEVLGDYKPSFRVQAVVKGANETCSP